MHAARLDKPTCFPAGAPRKDANLVGAEGNYVAKSDSFERSNLIVGPCILGHFG